MESSWLRRVSLWAPPVLYALAIFFSSSLVAPPSPPSQLTDKHVHLMVYAGFALVVLRALSGGRWSGVTIATTLQAAAVAIAYGASDEWHQAFVPDRHSDVADLVADAAGAALAVAAVGAMAWWGRRRTRTDSTIERAAGKVGHTP